VSSDHAVPRGERFELLDALALHLEIGRELFGALPLGLATTSILLSERS
jgi:hypothetical protein